MRRLRGWCGENGRDRRTPAGDAPRGETKGYRDAPPAPGDTGFGVQHRGRSPPPRPGREGGCGHRAKFGGGAEGGRHPLFPCGWGVPPCPPGLLSPVGDVRLSGRTGRASGGGFLGTPWGHFPWGADPRAGSPHQFLGAPGTTESVPVGHGGQAGSAGTLPSPLRPPVFSNWGNWSYWEEFSGCCALGPPPHPGGCSWVGETPARTPRSWGPPGVDFPAPLSGRLLFLQISSSWSQGIVVSFAPLG